MTRLLIAGAVLAATLGTATLGQAQDYPAQRAVSYRIVRIIPNLPSDTRRRDIAATPDCGAANPQGGMPSSVSWGGCP